MREPLVSPEVVARIRAKYSVRSEKEKRVVQSPKIVEETTRRESSRECGPLTEYLSSPSVKLCARCHIRESSIAGRSACHPCEALRAIKSREKHPKRWILMRIRANAKNRGIRCTLKERDIPDFPKFCPVLPWIELVYEVGKGRVGGEANPGAVSVDRIDSTKGYVPGNIRIISDRANRLKRDASDREMFALGKDAERRMAAKPKETNVN